MWNNRLRASQQELGLAHSSIGTMAAISLAVSMVAGLIAPRTFAYVIYLLALSTIVLARIGSIPTTIVGDGWRKLLFSFAAFCLFAAASAIWSRSPGATILSTLKLATVVSISVLATSLLSSDRVEYTRRALNVVVVTMVVVAVAAMIDIQSQMTIRRWMVNLLKLGIPPLSPTMYHAGGGEIIWIDPDVVNRSLVSLAVFVWPALLLARAKQQVFLGFGLYGLLTLVFLLSGSETAKLQLTLGTIVFCLMLYAGVWGRRVVLAGWIVACVLVVPLAVSLYDVGLHRAAWLTRYGEGASPAARIVIAHQYAERVWEAPMIGHGAAVSRELNRITGQSQLSQPHPHNAYLQIWFELGAVGMGLFMAVGLYLLNAFKSLPPNAQPYVHAQFASVATLFAPSYGFWQPWQSAMICFSIILTAAALACERQWAARA